MRLFGYVVCLISVMISAEPDKQKYLVALNILIWVIRQEEFSARTEFVANAYINADRN
jgi:hypothetical protein